MAKGRKKGSTMTKKFDSLLQILKQNFSHKKCMRIGPKSLYSEEYWQGWWQITVWYMALVHYSTSHISPYYAGNSVCLCLEVKEYAAIDFCSTERYTQWDGRQVIFYSVLCSSTSFYSVFEWLTGENRLWATFQYHFDNDHLHINQPNTFTTLINLTLITLITCCDAKRPICNHTTFSFAICSWSNLHSAFHLEYWSEHVWDEGGSSSGWEQMAKRRQGSKSSTKHWKVFQMYIPLNLADFLSNDKRWNPYSSLSSSKNLQAGAKEPWPIPDARWVWRVSERGSRLPWSPS